MIVGLGNPGRKYSKTRHNLGFMVIDNLSSAYGIKVNRKGFDAIWGEGMIEREKVILVKPQTFMNLSGRAVKGIFKSRNFETSDLLVISDDMDLGIGRIRVRQRGGSAGHKGVKSIIDALGTDNFARIRIGIGKSGDREVAEEYVLSPFSKSESPIAKEAVQTAAEASVIIIKDGVAEAMNKYNARNPNPPSPPLIKGGKGD
ncbi:MAG: aminoacyl-tRNA hydrolase [Nitrospirota bacterium]